MKIRPDTDPHRGERGPEIPLRGGEGTMRTFALLAVALAGLPPTMAAAADAPARLMEGLGRGVVAVNRGDGRVFVGWRLLGTDPDVAFNLYRSADGGEPA